MQQYQFIKNVYNPDKSKIFFIDIIDQEILTNDIGYLNVLSIEHPYKCRTHTIEQKINYL